MSRFDWMDRAACVTSKRNPDLWFSQKPTERVEAQRICGGCPVQAACRTSGNSAYRGIWAGEIRQPKNPGPSLTSEFLPRHDEHGTTGGYYRHIREGTTMCVRCSTAHTFANGGRGGSKKGAR